MINLLNGTVNVKITDDHLDTTSDMCNEATWALLMMALVCQTQKLGLDKPLFHELIDIAWQRVNEQKAEK